MTMEAHEWGPGELVGEHRLLRRLGRGERAEVWLAAPAFVEDGARVALKLARGGTAPGGMLREAEVLSRARGRHVVRLRDVIPVAAGRAGLVLEHVPHALEDVVGAAGAGSERLHAGAAVTVLAPLAAELHRLHGLGVVHGGVRIAAIGLRASGEPVLLGFGGATIERGAALEAGAQGDARDLRATALVVGALVGTETSRWAEFRRWLDAADPATGPWLVEFGRRAFEAAEPEPVALPQRTALAIGFGATAPASDWSTGAGGAVEPREDASKGGGALASLARRLPLGRVGGVRRRVWVPLAIVGAGLIAVAVALPAADGAAASVPGVTDATNAAGPGSSADSIAAMDAASAPSGSPAAERSSPTTESGSPAATSSPVTAGDETGHAAIRLLAARSRCYDELSIGCLAEVDESGSDAEAEDGAAIDALVDGIGELPPEFLAVAATEYQRLGDAAIVDAVDDAGAKLRLLLMLTPGGWRIRTYL